METLEQLQSRHRKEENELQKRIISKKKNATKKTRKGVNAECEQLERQMKDQHELELGELEKASPDIAAPAIDTPFLDDVVLPEASVEPALSESYDQLVEGVRSISFTTGTGSQDSKPEKRNRQKERLARRAAERDAAILEAENEAAKLPDWKQQEWAGMLKLFEENGLVEKEIAPDGHCMFSAFADQLSEAGLPTHSEARAGDATGPQAIRQVAAKYIESHPEDFAAFLDEPLEDYVVKIRDTAEWGGQVELIALSKNYNVQICVIQNGRIERFEPEGGNGKEVDSFWLAYYRHGYGLGEHYNSLRKVSRDTK